MLFSTVGQGYVFLWMVGAGLLIGALYALFAAVRRLLCAGFWLTLAADMLFGLSAGLILIAAMVTADYGRLRVYGLMGAGAGVALFRFGVDPPVRSLACTLRRKFRRILDRIAAFRLIKVIFK